MWRVMRTAAAAAVIASALVGCAPASAPSTDTPRTARTGTAAPSPDPSSSPSPTPSLRAAERAVEDMSMAEQAASVVMGHIPSSDPVAVREYMQAGFGGFIIMGANIAGTAEQVRALTRALTIDSPLPPLIAIDQEGGVVSRLPWDDLPAGRRLQDAPAEQVREVFAQRADLIAAAGANVNFGIVADVPGDRSSFIASRALGADPDSAASRVAAAVSGERGRVLSTLKHFPGHGAAPGDSHHSIPSTPMTLEEWRVGDGTPFAAGIDAGAELLMFGHLAYTAVDAAPASLSRRWHDIARKDLGFEGVLITDDLGMLTSSGVAAYRDPVANAVEALVAGNDMVLMVAGSTADTARAMADGITAAVAGGTLSEERLADAAAHVMTLRLQLAGG